MVIENGHSVTNNERSPQEITVNARERQKTLADILIKMRELDRDREHYPFLEYRTKSTSVYHLFSKQPV